MTTLAFSISHISLFYMHLFSGQQQLSKNRKKRGILLGDFNEYLTLMPNRLYMFSYIKKRLKVTYAGLRKPKIVRYESCMTLNQKVNNIKKSHFS